MNQPDVIINGKSIANLRGKITRHIMMFKPGVAELCAAVSSLAHRRQSSRVSGTPHCTLRRMLEHQAPACLRSGVYKTPQIWT